jgi:hypothetical protein
MVIRGSLTFRVGEETRELRPGGTWRILANTPPGSDRIRRRDRDRDLLAATRRLGGARTPGADAAAVARRRVVHPRTRSDGPAVARVTGPTAIIPLRDAQGSFMTFREAFPQASEEEEAFARTHYGSLSRSDDWLLPFRAFAIRMPDRVLLVDTGVGRNSELLPDCEGRLLEGLRAQGIEPRDIELVLLTHLHSDHVGWNLDAGSRVFS